jgi:two-component system response regulator ResD
MASRILVVDDESRMRKLVGDFLRRDGYEVLEAGDGQEAVDIFRENRDIALIIMDVMMPKMDGYQATKLIREESKVPIIMLTAKSEERDELEGFDLGVDEYVTKPFSPKTLVARVGAILRRSGATEKERIEIDGIVLDRAAHQVTIDGRPVELSFKEFELLAYFM